MSLLSSQDTRLIKLVSPSSDNALTNVTSRAVHPRKERELRDYLHLILTRKWLVLTIVVFATTFATLYFLSQPSLFEASATLQLDSKEYLYMQDSRGTVIRAYNNVDYQNTQILLLSNPQLVRQVILKLDLVHNPDFVNSLNDRSFISTVRNALRIRKPLPQKVATANIPVSAEANADELSATGFAQLEPFVSKVLTGLKVEPQPKSNLVTVRMTHNNPQTAKDIVDALTRIFVSNAYRFETKGAEQAIETLARQIADLQTKIKQAEDDRLNYLKSHNLPLGKGEGRNLTSERLGKFSSQLLDAESDRKKLETTYEEATKSIDSAPAVRDNEEIQALRKSILELERKRAALVEVYTKEWPDVKKLDAEIRQLHEQIAKSSSETVSGLKAKLESAVSREANLRQAYDREQGAANMQTQDEVALASLGQQIDTNRQVYDMLLKRYTEMQVNALDKSSHVAIVTPPAIPSSPIGPRRLWGVCAVSIASLLGACGLVVFMGQFDYTLKSAEEVAYHTSLPTLALIPAANDNGNGHGSLKEKVLLRLRKHDLPRALSLTDDIRSPTAEAYRHLRASLLAPTLAPSHRTILVTSGSPFEGKTTTAINMAVAIAQSGEEVLLMDCDLRRPRVHDHFNLRNSAGLTSYLSGEADIDSLIQSDDRYPRLKLITAGPALANPSDFLGSIDMRILLQVLGQRFAHVIIDSVPASSFADATIVSTMVDGVILVVHADRSSRRVVTRVKQRLETVGANIYGVVLNHVDLASDDYYYGYYNTYE